MRPKKTAKDSAVASNGDEGMVEFRSESQIETEMGVIYPAIGHYRQMIIIFFIEKSPIHYLSDNRTLIRRA